MIDQTIDEKQLIRTVQRAREQGIIIPPFEQQNDPALVPDVVKARLRSIGLWGIASLNLSPITWKNEPSPFGGASRGRTTWSYPLRIL